MCLKSYFLQFQPYPSTLCVCWPSWVIPQGFFSFFFFSFILWHFRAIKKLAYLRILQLSKSSLLWAHQKGWVLLWIVWAWILRSKQLRLDWNYCKSWKENEYVWIDWDGVLDWLTIDCELKDEFMDVEFSQSVTPPGTGHTWYSVYSHINRRIRLNDIACWQHKIIEALRGSGN